MTLCLRRLFVTDVRLGTPMALDGGTLTIDGQALGAALEARDARIAAVRVHVTAPGESTRIVCVKDVIQPGVKPEGVEPGTGVTTVVQNVAVVTCGPIVGFQEGIIDMSGPGASYTPFSGLSLIVVEIEVAEGTSPHAHEALLRVSGLKAAEHIAMHCTDAEPDETQEIRWAEIVADAALPRIAYVDMVLSQGLLHDTYVLGRDAKAGLPVVLDPRVVIDGGVVSGNCVSACDKNTTYHHQNNPIIGRLLAGHGESWNFVGVVITNEPTRLGDKERSAKRTIELIHGLEAQGAIISKEGFGNPDADLMMIVKGLEQLGIRAVALTDEYAGADGASQSLADTTPEADAMVSVGNANERIRLPAMARTIGPLPDVARLAGGYAGSLQENGSLEVELQAIVGATNQLGFGRLSCREI